MVLSEKIWPTILVFYAVENGTRLGDAKMRDSRQALRSMKMFISLGQSRGTEGFTGKKEWTSVGPGGKRVINVFWTTIELNTIVHAQDKSIPTDDPVPTEPLYHLSVTSNNIRMRVLKYNGCYTKVVSLRLVERNKNCFRHVEKSLFCSIQEKVLLRYPQHGFSAGHYRLALRSLGIVGSLPIPDMMFSSEWHCMWKTVQR